MSRVLINGQDVNMTDGFPEMHYAEWKALPRDLRPDFTIIKDRNYTSEPLDNSVSVTADGVKTYATLLNELFALVDKNRIGRNSILVWNESNQNFIYHTGQNAPSTGATYFERATVSPSNWQIISIRLQGASKIYMNVSGSTSDVSSTVAASGITISLYYNIVSSGWGIDTVKSVVLYENLNCTANTDSYVANQSFTIPSGYELVAVTNVHITDIATKPVVLRSWRKESGNAITFYWSNFGSTAVAVNVVAELLLRQV